MVNNHVMLKIIQWGFIILANFLVDIQAYALAELELSIPNKQVELGKPIQLRLYSPQSVVSINDIDLTGIKQNFHIKSTSEIQLKDNKQTRLVTLYPRNTGSVIIPELYFINTRTRAKKIDVTPARDPKNNSELNVKYTVSTLSPWKKQQVLVKIELTGKASILRLNTPQAYSDHSEIISLAQYSNPTNGNSNLTRHITGWAVFPRQSGVKKLELPGIQLVRDGVVTHQFFPPLYTLDIKPLPVYIPATMPVGKLKLVIPQQPGKLALTGTIYNSKVNLAADGITPSDMPSITDQFKSNADIRFYPTTTIRDRYISEQGVRTEEKYSISYKTLRQGFLSVNNISLNYFDPESGTIRRLHNNIKTSFSLHASIAIVIAMLILTSIFIIVSRGMKILFNKYNTFMAYKKIFNSIPGLKNSTDIRQVLNDIARAEHWHNNLSLQQWHQQWLKNTKHPCPVSINKLELMLYAGKNSDIDQLKQGIKQLCFFRWSLLRYFTQ